MYLHDRKLRLQSRAIYAAAGAVVGAVAALAVSGRGASPQARRAAEPQMFETAVHLKQGVRRRVGGWMGGWVVGTRKVGGWVVGGGWGWWWLPNLWKVRSGLYRS